MAGRSCRLPPAHFKNGDAEEALRGVVSGAKPALLWSQSFGDVKTLECLHGRLGNQFMP